MVDPVIEVYTHGIASKTLQDDTYGIDGKDRVKDDLFHLLP